VLDLRGGTSLWEAKNGATGAGRPLTQSAKCDIVIIGSGITGSFIAERLSRDSRSILVLDRNRPQMASTAASTSLLQWEIDTPLCELAEMIGFENAAEVYHASINAVRDIVALVRELEIDCHCSPRNSLYLAGTELGPEDLADEQKSRERAGIASALLDGRVLADRFGLLRPAALFDKGCAEADPMALARGLMGHAISRGVKVHSPINVVDYEMTSRGVSVLTDAGFEVGGQVLILANGYEMPSFVPARQHRIVSTWVVATEPVPRGSWSNDALIWEASDPYLYARPTADHRIIVGGEDEAITDPDERDAKIAGKARLLLKKMSALKPGPSLSAGYAWSGFFGTTEDGLPLIGPVPGHSNVFAAFGYGGNGITFSAIAAELVGQALAGRHNTLLHQFAIDR
jgi:glycine/D-amino acid oxidase-like deaminating enzyme